VAQRIAHAWAEEDLAVDDGQRRAGALTRPMGCEQLYEHLGSRLILAHVAVGGVQVGYRR
jgi:hypothetical protein